MVVVGLLLLRIRAGVELIFVQVLGKLCCFPTSSFSNDDAELLLLDHVQELFSSCKDGQVLAHLLDLLWVAWLGRIRFAPALLALAASLVA